MFFLDTQAKSGMVGNYAIASLHRWWVFFGYNTVIETSIGPHYPMTLTSHLKYCIIIHLAFQN